MKFGLLAFGIGGLLVSVGIVGWYRVVAKHRVEPDERQVGEAVNRLRAENKLPPLVLDDSLAIVARRHARRMAEGGSLSVPSRKWLRQELVAAGYITSLWSVCVDAKSSLDPLAVVAGWRDCERTRAELLQTKYVDCGVGIATDRAQSKHFIAIVLATRSLE